MHDISVKAVVLMKINPLLTVLGLIVLNVTPMIVKAQSPLPSPTAKDTPQKIASGNSRRTPWCDYPRR